MTTKQKIGMFAIILIVAAGFCLAAHWDQQALAAGLIH